MSVVISNVYVNATKRDYVHTYTRLSYITNLSKVYPSVDFKNVFATAVADPAFADATVVFWVERPVKNISDNRKAIIDNLREDLNALQHAINTKYWNTYLNNRIDKLSKELSEAGTQNTSTKELSKLKELIDTDYTTFVKFAKDKITKLTNDLNHYSDEQNPIKYTRIRNKKETKVIREDTSTTVDMLYQNEWKIIPKLKDRRVFFVTSKGHIEINAGKLISQSIETPLFNRLITYFRDLHTTKLKVSVVHYELHKYLVSDYNMTTDKATKLIDSIKKQAALQDSAFTQRLNIYKSAFELSLPDKLSSEDKVLYTYLDFLSTVRYPEGLTDYIRSFHDIEEATVFTDALSKLTKGTVLIDPSSILEPEIAFVSTDAIDKYTMKIKDLI